MPIQRRHAASSAGVEVPSLTRRLMTCIFALYFASHSSFASFTFLRLLLLLLLSAKGELPKDSEGGGIHSLAGSPSERRKRHQSPGAAAPRATLAPLAPSGRQGASPVEEPSVVETRPPRWPWPSPGAVRYGADTPLVFQPRAQPSLPPPLRGGPCATDLHRSTAGATVTPGSPHCSGRLSNKMATGGGGGGTDG